MAPKAKEKPKPQPQPAAAVEDLFSALHRHTQEGQYNQAVKVADQVLSIIPGDQDALRCKVVSLIKGNLIDRALSVIKDSQGLPIDLSFHKAYCLYRQNKFDEALQSLGNLEKNAMVMQLEAQILYRLEKTDACLECYESLEKSKLDSLDYKANYIATLVTAGKASEVEKKMAVLRVKTSSSFELAYNNACSLISRGKYAEAEQQLLVARRIGQEMLMEDDFTEEEIESELAPITVQLAYVRQLLGHAQEALEAYTDIIKKDLDDSSSLAVAVNNLISLKGTKDVSDSLKKLDKLVDKTNGMRHIQFTHGLDSKLPKRQKEAIYSNMLLLLLHANKLDQAEELVSSLQEMYPNSVAPVLLQAAVLVRGKKVPKAEIILGQYADSNPEKSKQVLLARAQIAAAAGHFQIAADSLAKISDIQYLPGPVATIVSLRERANDINGAFAALDSALQWWKNSMTEDDTKLHLIMNEAAAFKCNHGLEGEAAKLYEELVKSHGSIEALLGFVRTAALVDVDKAEAYEKKLRPLPGLKGVNLDNLEKTSGAKPLDGPLSRMDIPEEAKEKTKPKRKRKRKPRYPKGFDPANPGPPPDPERWLPRRERSTYRPKRKDKRAQIRGSQGAVVREKHEANATSNAGNTESNPNPKSGAVSSSKAGTSSQQSKQSKSKSRKKSRS